MLKYLCEVSDENAAALVAAQVAKGKTVIVQDGSHYISIDSPTRKDKII